MLSHWCCLGLGGLLFLIFLVNKIQEIVNVAWPVTNQ